MYYRTSRKRIAEDFQSTSIINQLFSAQARQNWPHIFTKQIESLSLEKTELSAYFAVLFFKDSDLENHKNWFFSWYKSFDLVKRFTLNSNLFTSIINEWIFNIIFLIKPFKMQPSATSSSWVWVCHWAWARTALRQ